MILCPYCDKEYEGASGILSCPTGYKNFHVLIPKFSLGKIELPPLSDVNIENNPFILFKELFLSYKLLKSGNIIRIYRQVIDQINQGLEKLGEQPLFCTQLLSGKRLEEKLGLPKNTLFVKFDAANITGSHKVRHAMGNILYFEALRVLKGERSKKDLAIYSCGNAALGASAIASTLGYKLYTFVPENVSQEIVKRLIFYGARVVKVKREDLGSGDPCYNRFAEGIKKLGFMPCSCSGPDNWPNIEGGATLFYEMAMQMRNQYDTDFDTIIVQVGGGALASSVVYAISVLQNVGFMKKMPKIICVQTESCYPLYLAYEKVKKYKRNNPRLSIQSLVRDIGQKASLYMSAWTKNVPESLAEGILDDTTYDWLNVVEGILESGGEVIVVKEEEIEEAFKIAKSLGFNVSATGTAGLAGLLKLLKEKRIEKGEKIGLFFTGIDIRKKVSINGSELNRKVITLNAKDPIMRILAMP